ncbi:MAG: M56 family metallopeptidase [Pirellulales bacterium]
MTPAHVLASPAVSAAVERLGWVLAHSLWQFAAVATVAAAALAVLRHSTPTARHGVLVCSLLTMLALPMATWGLVDVAAGTTAPSRTGGHAFAPAAAAFKPHGPRMAIAPALRPGLPADRDLTSAVLRARLRPWLGWCVTAWLVGVAACAVRPLVGWLAWRRLVAAGEAVPAEVARLVERACRRLGVSQSVKVLASAAVRVPAVTGWLKPVMLVPVSLLTALPPAQLETLLAHELAHVRRGDIVVLGLQILLETLAFYHPAVWWLSGRLRVEREHCCDDLVVTATGSCAAYGRALVAVEELRGAAAAVALSAADGSLLSRIRRLATGVEPRSSGWPLPVFATAGIAGFVIAASLLGTARADEVPADTNTMESLSPQQARTLAKEFAGDRFPLNGLTTLDADTAEALATFKGQVLRLDGLTTVDADTATALAEFKGSLTLDGIEELSPEVAVALSKKVGEHSWISLAGLRTLTPEAARAVGGCKNILSRSFPRLRTLSPEAARELIDGIQRNPRRIGGAVLDLSGIETLTPELAAELANNREVTIMLGGLRDLSPEAAVALEKYRGNLWIRCPGGRLTPELLGLMTAAGFKNGAAGGGKDRTEWTGIKFHLVGLEMLTPEDVANLAQANPFNPWLGGIQRLEPATAKAIVVQLPRNSLYFPNLVDVPAEFAGASLANKDLQIGYDPDAAKQLVRSAETLTPEIARLVVSLGDSGHASALEGITAIESPDAARIAAILATSKAGLALPNLRRISPKTLASLTRKEDVEIPLIHTLEFIREPDGSDTDDFVIPKWLETRQKAAR